MLSVLKNVAFNYCKVGHPTQASTGFARQPDDRVLQN